MEIWSDENNSIMLIAKLTTFDCCLVLYISNEKLKYFHRIVSNKNKYTNRKIYKNMFWTKK